MKVAEQDKRFVVHQHISADSSAHWDLMLESGDTLQTWRLAKLPQEVFNADEASGVKTLYIEPGSPRENGYKAENADNSLIEVGT